MHTCRFCDQYGRHDDLVRYGKRHYAHPACYLDAGKALQALPAWEVAQFPWRLLKERGLLDEAEALTVKVDAIRCGLRNDRPAA